MTAKKRVGEILEEMGLIGQELIQKALSKQKDSGEKIGQILIGMGAIEETDLIKALAKQCGLPFLEELPETPDKELLKVFPLESMERHQIVPIRLDHRGCLKAATTNPINVLTVDSIKINSKREIDLVFTSPKELRRVLAHFEKSRVYFKGGSESTAPTTASEEDKAAIVKMVHHIVTEAVQKKASDIHFEVSRKDFAVRYRMDGVLQEIEAPQKEVFSQVISRIKVMAGLDLAEKRLPQDGRVRFMVDGKKVDLRVSILPSIHGESVVMRVLGTGEKQISLSELGFREEHNKTFRDLITLPYGIIFVTGPTGSGKTTTLYGALQSLNEPGQKIITVEDPVEYELDGINQVQVKPKIGLDFAKTLRATLRQAPTIILVGEIRDYETAEIAIQAALTGHLVFSTLHTNDAISAIPRLIDLGIKPYLVAAATQGVMAQRLVRKICENCKKEVKGDPSLEGFLKRKGLLENHNSFWRGSGCEECQGTGFRGRIALFEILPLNEKLRMCISKEPFDMEELRRLVKGYEFQSLYTDGLGKVAEGMTTLEEVLRVAEEEAKDHV